MEDLLLKLRAPTLKLFYSLKEKFDIKDLEQYMRAVRIVVRDEIKNSIHNASFFQGTILRATLGRLDEFVENIYDNILDRKSLPEANIGFIEILEEIPFDENFLVNFLTKIRISNKALNIYLADYLDNSVKLIVTDPIRAIDNKLNQEAIASSIRMGLSQVEALFSTTVFDEPKRKRKRT